MTKKKLLEIRTNTNLAVNYSDLTLTPEIELIMLFVEPKYEVKKGAIYKGGVLNEFRIKTDKDGISQIIGALQALQAQVQTFDNMAEGLNVIIKANTKPTA